MNPNNPSTEPLAWIIFQHIFFTKFLISPFLYFNSKKTWIWCVIHEQSSKFSNCPYLIWMVAFFVHFWIKNFMEIILSIALNPTAINWHLHFRYVTWSLLLQQHEQHLLCRKDRSFKPSYYNNAKKKNTPTICTLSCLHHLVSLYSFFFKDESGYM